MTDTGLLQSPIDADDGLDTCFHRISALMGKISGVQLPSNKSGLVRSRLRKRLRRLGHRSFSEYIDFVESPEGKEELSTMVDLLTTNKTSFYREPAHFEFLEDVIVPELGARPAIWCAGCSSGEEPYTIAMVLRASMPERQAAAVRILATDLSSEVLSKAREAVYPRASASALPKGYERRFFSQATGPDGTAMLEVDGATRAMIRFARLNLMRPWPMHGPFDAIFCRNVMIYFDKPTREDLVRRFSALLAPGGHFFVGHSEGLNNLRHDLRYVQPAVYAK